MSSRWPRRAARTRNSKRAGPRARYCWCSVRLQPDLTNHTMRSVLSKRMSPRAFENGYWYQAELVEFGKTLGLPAAHRMRMNELESAIAAYLTTGRLPNKISSKPLKKG